MPPTPLVGRDRERGAIAAPFAASLRSMFADDLSDDVLDAAPAAMERATSPYSFVEFRGLGGAMARVPSDVYVNFLQTEGDSRVREAYPPATYARLAAIKQRYGPINLFRHNQNIRARS